VPHFSDKQIADAIRGTQRFRVYPFPDRADLKIAVRCLSEAEMDGIEIAALQELEQYGKARRWDVNVMADAAAELNQRLIQRRIVLESMYDPDTIASDKPIPFFTRIDEVGSLDTITAQKLMQLYVEHQSWINPLHGLDEAGAKELAAALGKELASPAACAELLSGYDRSTLVRLLIASVSGRLTS